MKPPWPDRADDLLTSDEQDAVDAYRHERFTRLALNHGISVDIVELAFAAGVSPSRFETLLEQGVSAELALDLLT